MIIQLSRKLAGPAAVLMCSLGIADARGQELSFGELKSELEVVLELITKRQLSGAEIERAAEEFHAHFDGDCDQTCVEAIEFNKQLVEPMATQPGSPRDLLARQWFSRELYFSEAQAGSFIQRLTNEADPIRLADTKSGRVMTEGDAVGLMNINNFLRDGGEPTPKSFAADQIEEHISALRQDYIEEGLSLPYRAALAAELWTGLHQNWDGLDGDQKDAVIAYLSDREFRAVLDVPTYRSLLGLNEDEAIALQSDNLTAQRDTRLEWVVYRSLRVSEAAGNVRASGSYCYFCR